jgi:hypothetical protein
MNEEGAKFKLEKQLPAPDAVKKTLKYSSKKPWVIEKEWKKDVKFSINRGYIKDYRFEKEESISYTYEELLKLKEDGKYTQADYFYPTAWGPQPYGIMKYKTKKSALQAWENFKQKGEFSEKANYTLVNKKTGETIKLCP